MRILSKYKIENRLIPKAQYGVKVPDTVLNYWRKQGIVLPPSRNEQISADNRTKELRNYQNTQQQINQNLEKGKYLNFWTQPYSGFSGRQAAELGNNLFKQSIYAGAGEVAGTYALQGLGKLTKFIPKRRISNKIIETKVGPKTYEELRIPGNESTKEVDAAIDYKKSSKPFKYDYSSIDNFYKSYFEDATITGEKLEKLDSGAKWIADNTFKGYVEHLENLEHLITKTKGDRLKLVRHIKDDIPIGEYEPKRPLSFSFPKGDNIFGNNRLIVEIPEEQSYLAIEKLLAKYPEKAGSTLDMVENEVLLPRKLRFQVTRAKKPNEFGGDDYIGKILNPYLMPLITIPYDRKNN